MNALIIIMKASSLCAVICMMLLSGCSYYQKYFGPRPKQSKIIRVWKGGDTWSSEGTLSRRACGISEDDTGKYLQDGWTIKSNQPFSYNLTIPREYSHDIVHTCTGSEIVLEREVQ